MALVRDFAIHFEWKCLASYYSIQCYILYNRIDKSLRNDFSEIRICRKHVITENYRREHINPLRQVHAL